MRWIRKYNESLNKTINEDDLREYFIHTSDLVSGFEINDIYFDPETNEWASNDFSNPSSPNHPKECVKGWSVSLNHNFFDRTSIEELKKYLHLLNELNSDLDRFIKNFNPQFAELDLGSGEITIIIRP